MILRRLHPDLAEVDATTYLQDVDFGALAPPDRPYVVLNMVSSVDGRGALDGVTEGLSGPADKAVFFALRSSVDAVLAGTGTLAAERYRRLIRRPERIAQREARGLHGEPVALILSRSGAVPYDIPLFEDPGSRPVVLTGADAEPLAALRRVRAEHGVRSVLCEGGPRLNAGLLAAGVVDELFLTVSPIIAATPVPLTIVETDGAVLAPAPATLVSIHESEGMLFLRYAIG